MKQTLNNHPEKKPHREIAALIESERPHLLRYACYRLGNADDAEDAVQDIFLQAEVIRLRIHGNNSFSDIAAILDIPVTTAKSRFQYGIEKIRKGIKS